MIVVRRIFESVPVPEQGLDPALAVLRLSRRYSGDRVEAACQLALKDRIRSPRYAHIHPILATGQDKAPASPPTPPAEAGGFVRGGEYYTGGVR